MSRENLHDILDDVESAGYRVSVDQFKRWKKRGLIPKGKIEGFGQGLGSESSYPNGTTEVVLEIAAALEEKRDLSFVAWRLWGIGYNIPTVIRKEAEKAFGKKESRDRLELRSIQGRTANERRRRSPDEQVIADRLGRKKAKQITEVILSVFLGEILESELTAEQESTLKDLLDTIPTEPTIRISDLLQVLRVLLTGASGLFAVQNSEDEDLITIRNEALKAWELMRGFPGIESPYLPSRIFRIWLCVRRGDHPFTQEVHDFLYSDEYGDLRDLWVGEIRNAPWKTRKQNK